MTIQKDEAAFADFLNKNIYDCADHYDYIELQGGIHKLNELRQKEFMLHKEVENGGL